MERCLFVVVVVVTLQDLGDFNRARNEYNAFFCIVFITFESMYIWKGNMNSKIQQITLQHYLYSFIFNLLKKLSVHVIGSASDSEFFRPLFLTLQHERLK